jgi:hypothetical protein
VNGPPARFLLCRARRLGGFPAVEAEAPHHNNKGDELRRSAAPFSFI